ncbi:polyprenyl synthetase family protein [Nesterenkonia flava]|uniref:Polyprenyl synthetase family protein n=1 Tax=Nesterenkonia flava TaxID=469799 RepID=A0ABU1FXU9_9MICC|nr:polyprenyl synthetase family protein [Nesterenkonia flava]MDR5713006.1 polyprenyl synthetase family protein [Nesterenkonia flava]
MSAEDFVGRVNARCETFLQRRREEILSISPEGAPLADSLLALTSGGKKLRPVLAWIGWRAAVSARSGGGPELPASEASAAELLGVALELFQAAALVHDDVIDRSDVRRGQPSTHKRFEALHREHAYSGDAPHFGTTGAVLSGDLALGWAGQAFAEAQQQSSGAPETLDAARRVFQQMHTEVITGQYLDVLAEVGPPAPSEAEAVARARNVLRFKAAKYSSEYPVVLGCALGGGGEDLRRNLGAASLPVGEAFQLRDDLLGVFGDPEVTGKPVGDDLREGKRTELIAYGLFRSPEAAAAELAGMLGNPDLSDDDVSRAREILVSSGAVAEVERSIETLMDQSRQELDGLKQLGVAAEVLEDFADVSRRLVSRLS